MPDYWLQAPVRCSDYSWQAIRILGQAVSHATSAVGAQAQTLALKFPSPRRGNSFKNAGGLVKAQYHSHFAVSGQTDSPDAHTWLYLQEGGV